jgi:hypothetical protein
MVGQLRKGDTLAAVNAEARITFSHGLVLQFLITLELFSQKRQNSHSSYY